MKRCIRLAPLPRPRPRRPVGRRLPPRRRRRRDRRVGQRRGHRGPACPPRSRAPCSRCPWKRGRWSSPGRSSRGSTPPTSASPSMPRAPIAPRPTPSCASGWRGRARRTSGRPGRRSCAREADLDGAEKDLARMEGLLASGSGTTKSRDDARTRRDVAAASLEAVRERLRRLEAGSRREEKDAGARPPAVGRGAHRPAGAAAEGRGRHQPGGRRGDRASSPSRESWRRGARAW